MIVPKRVYVGDVSSYPSYVGIISSTINQYSMESKAFFFRGSLGGSSHGYNFQNGDWNRPLRIGVGGWGWGPPSKWPI